MYFPGRDAAFVGPNENHFAILDEDKTGLALYILPGAASQESKDKNSMIDGDQAADFDINDVTTIKGPLQFIFESEVDRIFSTPLGNLVNNILILNLLIGLENSDCCIPQF